MSPGRVTGLVLASVALLWGLLFLTSPFRYHGPRPCEDVNDCEGPFIECQPALLGGDVVVASDVPWADGADERCERGGRRRLLAVSLLGGTPLLAVVAIAFVPAVRSRSGQARSARR